MSNSEEDKLTLVCPAAPQTRLVLIVEKVREREGEGGREGEGERERERERERGREGRREGGRI